MSAIVPQNGEQIGIALNLLTQGLRPYVVNRLLLVYQDNWPRAVNGSLRDERLRAQADIHELDWDAHALLTVMWDQWNAAFRTELGHAERSLVSELREFRNRWAHQQEFDFDDTYRVLDSVRRLLAAIQADNLPLIQAEKRALLENHVAEEVNTQIQRTAFRRNKWWVIAIYSLCCLFLLWHMVSAGRTGATALASILVLTLVYLIYQQFKMEPPLLYGPRECPRCKKIIYRRTCPYCP